MPFAAFDCAMCANRTCPHWDGDPRCGRSTKNFEGVHIILEIGSFRPDANGYCRAWKKPTTYKIEPWMTEMAERYEQQYQHEMARQRMAQDANSLDADNLDKEV